MDVYDATQLAALALDPEAPIVDQLISAGDKVLLVAKYKAAKSVLMQQLAHCVATGVPFLGLRVPVPRVVLYVAGEGDTEEIQERTVAMSAALPLQSGLLWYALQPDRPLNTPQGLADLLAVGRNIRPALTIFDPVYALMAGSLSKDEAVGAFMRNLNRYQKQVSSAVVVVHHTHRAIRSVEGELVVEGDEAFMGSMLFKAWPKLVLLLTMRADKTRVLSCETHRRSATRIAIAEKPLELVLVEPFPLLFVVKRAGVGADAEQVSALLRLATDPLSTAELEKRSERSHGGVVQALQTLCERGEAVKVEGRPARYTLRQSEVSVPRT